MTIDDEKKEIRSQRHDFIKEYYKMATLDLDRHLKGGWQTIAVLAGGAAILTAGHDGKIGLPISTSIALVAAIWGTLTVVDANYWSLRAIGFLANVEAVYFSAPDRRRFNPYMGYHPPYKLLDSLKYLFWLCVALGTASIVDMLWELVKNNKTLFLFYTKLSSIGPVTFAFWSLPFLIAIWGIYWVYRASMKRIAEYHSFCSDSPGPGVRLDDQPFRHITGEQLIGESAPLIEVDTQAGTLRQVERSQRVYNFLFPISVALLGITNVGFAGIVIYKYLTLGI